jgi:hypothetical protein
MSTGWAAASKEYRLAAGVSAASPDPLGATGSAKDLADPRGVFVSSAARVWNPGSGQRL